MKWKLINLLLLLIHLHYIAFDTRSWISADIEQAWDNQKLSFEVQLFYNLN